MAAARPCTSTCGADLLFDSSSKGTISVFLASAGTLPSVILTLHQPRKLESPQKMKDQPKHTLPPASRAAPRRKHPIIDGDPGALPFMARHAPQSGRLPCQQPMLGGGSGRAPAAKFALSPPCSSSFGCLNQTLRKALGSGTTGPRVGPMAWSPCQPSRKLSSLRTARHRPGGSAGPPQNIATETMVATRSPAESTAPKAEAAALLQLSPVQHPVYAARSKVFVVPSE